MSTPVWRLILDPPRSGPWNMSVDKAIQISHADGKGIPTLRVYGWSEPTLSLGRFQAVEEVDFDAATASGVVVVRRPTGGRAVLHDDEVTYSFVAGVGDGVPRGVRASYAWILRALLATYHLLGIDVSQPNKRQESHRYTSPSCYGSSTSADLTVNMKKLSGSAQVWLGSTVLQHGSLCVTKDVSTEAELLRLDSRQIESLITSTSTISSVCRPAPTHEAITSALIAGFTDALGVRFEETLLSAEEYSIADEISSQFAVVQRPKPQSSSSSKT